MECAMSMALIKSLQEQRDSAKAALNTLNETAAAESRSFNDVEQSDYDTKVADIRSLDERIKDEIDAELRSQKIAASGADFSGVAVTNEPNPVYRADGSESFFRDTFLANNKGNMEARDRLVRSQETRTGDLASSSSSTGGTFAPPLWLVDEFVKLARPGRPLADLMHSADLPSGVSSINLPTVATGSATGTQSSQNTAVTDTALTTGSVSTGITTVAGQQTVSLQMIEQSGIPFDRVILGDLAADYAKQIDALVVADLTGTSSIISVAEATSLTGALVYSNVANAISQVSTARYLPPDAIVMSPARWYWLVSQVDGNGRPLVVPNGPAFNQIASTGAPAAEGAVGTMLGLPVYLDAQMPVSGTSPAPANAIYVIRRDDLWLFESPVQTASFDATYANQLTVLFRIHGYVGFIPRYAKSIAQIGGAAYSTAPAFA